MADRIKGITVVIGGDTTGLSKALSGVNKEISSTQKQLKDVERLLKLDPGNTELLAQKQRLLNDAVDQTKTKLNALQDAEKQVQQQFEKGEVSQEQYDGLKREIIATEAELRNAEKAAYDMQEQLMQSASEKALQDLEDAAADLDRQLEKVDGKDLADVSDAAKTAASSIDKIDEQPVEDVAGAASDAKTQLKGASQEASTFSDVLSAETLVEGGKNLIDTVSSLADETQEYRKIMGTLDTSSAKAGYTANETAAAYSQLYGVLGDDQTTATTVANLQALSLEQSDLMNMLRLVTGAWATYGDSIPIDGLAESVNETIRTGTVTGTLPVQGYFQPGCLDRRRPLHPDRAPDAGGRRPGGDGEQRQRDGGHRQQPASKNKNSAAHRCLYHQQGHAHTGSRDDFCFGGGKA